MHPIERLRFVARSTEGGLDEVALEAAEALADLAGEPRALVPACRRLLDAQPLNGPLWWLAANVLGAGDPAVAARRCARELASDPTAPELAAAFSSGTVLAAEATETTVRALAERPDCRVRLFGAPRQLRWSLRVLADGPAGGSGATGHGLGDVASDVTGASVVVVEALAASSAGILLEVHGAALAGEAAEAGAELWVVAGVGRVLPEAVFENCARRAPPGQRVPARLAGRLAGPTGLVDPLEGLSRLDCPSPAGLTDR